MTKLEHVKNGQIPEKKWNLVVSKPENDNLRYKDAIKVQFDFSREKNHSFIAETKLQVDQVKKKMEPKFNKPLFVWKSNIFKSQNDHKFSSNKLETKLWSWLETELDLSLVSFDLKYSVI